MYWAYFARSSIWRTYSYHKEKDEIEIDIANRKINLNIDQKTFDLRMKSIEKFEPKIIKGIWAGMLD